MTPHLDAYGTEWIPVSAIAREFNKTERTIRNWCHSGFILTLGYRTKRDHTGHWLIATLISHHDPQPPTTETSASA